MRARDFGTYLLRRVEPPSGSEHTVVIGMTMPHFVLDRISRKCEHGDRLLTAVTAPPVPSTMDPPKSPTPHGLFRLALRAVHRANGVARLEGAAPPPPFWPTYCPRLLFGAPVGFAKPVVFLRRHLRCPYFAAHHGDRYRTLACLSGPASHPVSQSK